MSDLDAVTAYLHEEIPLTRSLGLRITSWDGRTVSLAAPLLPNQNHADTAFGGSISSLGIMAGYSLLYLLCLERKISTRILIQKSATDFLRPIDDDMVATAALPSAESVEEFFASLARRRRARLQIESQILCRNLLGATHSGLYLAMIY